MNPIHDAISKRRSIRKYRPDPIAPEILDRILQAGIRASSSGNMQAYSVIVTTDPAIRRELYKPHFEQDMVLEAPALLTFCADFRRMRRWLQLRNAADNFDNFMSFMISAIDAILVAQTAAIAAEAEGLGICYMGTTLASCDEIARILKCPDNVVPVVGYSIGYPDETPACRDRLPLSSLVHRETYSDPTDEEILNTYRDRETRGWERYMAVPELRKMIEDSGARNLAQIYTQVKYTRESHLDYSDTVIRTLAEKRFLESLGLSPLAKKQEDQTALISS